MWRIATILDRAVESRHLSSATAAWATQRSKAASDVACGAALTMQPPPEAIAPPASMRLSFSSNGPIAMPSGSSCSPHGPTAEGGDAIEERPGVVGVGEDRPAERAHEPHLVGRAAIGTRPAERREVGDHGITPPHDAFHGAARAVRRWPTCAFCRP